MQSRGKKSERLSQLELLLVTHPEGMRRAEIARRLGVHRATIGRYIDELSSRTPIWERDFLVGIESGENHTLMKLSLLESLTFYLAFKSFKDNLRIRFPEGAAAIRKLSRLLRGYAPFFSNRLTEISDGLDSHGRVSDRKTIVWLEVLTEAWISGKPVLVSYKNEGRTLSGLFFVCAVEIGKEETSRNSLTVCLQLTTDGMRPVYLPFEQLESVNLVVDTEDSSSLKEDSGNINQDNLTEKDEKVFLAVKDKKYIDTLRHIAGEDFELLQPVSGFPECSFIPESEELLLGLVAASREKLIIIGPEHYLSAFRQLKADIVQSIELNLTDTYG